MNWPFRPASYDKWQALLSNLFLVKNPVVPKTAIANPRANLGFKTDIQKFFNFSF